MMMLGTSVSVAGGKYLVRPDSEPIAVSAHTVKTKRVTRSKFRGTHRLNRLKRFKRSHRLKRFMKSKHTRGTFVRMKRAHFIR